MRMSVWSSDVCSSDLCGSTSGAGVVARGRFFRGLAVATVDAALVGGAAAVTVVVTGRGTIAAIIPATVIGFAGGAGGHTTRSGHAKIGRASCREEGFQCV